MKKQPMRIVHAPTGSRFRHRECRQCQTSLVRISPNKPHDDLRWFTSFPVGVFFCEKCQLQKTLPLIGDEPRDIELAPRVQA